jgi:hypothetical protein
MSTPVKRKYGGSGGNGGGGGGGGNYGNGQINAYPPVNPAGAGAAGAVMMSLAEELLTKKGLSLKDLHEEQEEYAETGDKVGGRRGGAVCNFLSGGARLCRARFWRGMIPPSTIHVCARVSG